jgi:hypothetical protein
VFLATVQYQVMGRQGISPATPGKISSLPEPLAEHICVLCCSRTSRAALGSFCHVAVQPWGGRLSDYTGRSLRSCEAEPHTKVTGLVA